MTGTITAVIAAGALFAGSGGAAPAGSGVYGRVYRGPVTPLCSTNIPCDEPAAHATLSLARHAKVFRLRTDAAGRYRIRLAPGLYRVYESNWGPGRVMPTAVRVPAGRFARVDFRIDTGIR